jgi:hypothetical protein
MNGRGSLSAIRCKPYLSDSSAELPSIRAAI